MNDNGAWLALVVAGAAAVGSSGRGGREGSPNSLPVLPLAALGVLAGGAAYFLARRRTPIEPDFTVPLQEGAPPAPSSAPTTSSRKFINPLGSSTFRLSSPYGPRTNPVTGEQRLHNGMDLAAKTGTPIYAAEGGTVSKVWLDHPTNGNAVKIQHPDGWSTAYLHMVGAPLVALGQSVSRGQQIGNVGTTGRSTGPHLHFITYAPTGEASDPSPITDLTPWTPAPAMV
jgi:murein DD-endopeptidase MepM/ murein hydrolase activator NlpD